MNEELIHKIERIKIQTKRLAHDLFAGAYHSIFKGRGIEFEEVRPYQSGDDIRTIDWNVTARMQTPFSKVYREEREISVILLVDISASSHFQNKQDFIAEVAAVIAFSAIENHDRVSLVLFSDEIELYLPPRKGTNHVLRLIRELLAFEPKSKGTDIGAALNFLGKISLQKGICFVISDFLDQHYADPLKRMAQKHDIITLQVIDPMERQLPKGAWITLEDLETGEQITVNSRSKKVQKKLQESLLKRVNQHKKLLNQAGAEGIVLETDRSYIDPLRQFFKRRKQKR